MTRNRSFWLISLAAIAGAFLLGREWPESPSSAPPPRLAFFVGGSGQFWKTAIAGAERSAKDHRAELSVIVPTAGSAEQTAKLLTISPEKFDGLAISPLDPAGQSRRISELASQMFVITYDNDVPLSLRHSHVGVNNYVAGRLCGELIQRAIPEGGTIAVFVSDHSRDVSRLRRQGLVDVLAGAHRVPGKDLDPLEEVIEAGEYKILRTYLDDSDPVQAEANALLALKDLPSLDCMVGLNGYSAPNCLKALRSAGRLGVVKVVGFDQFKETLNGIKEGTVYGTVAQDPFLYGYEAVRLLVNLAQDEPHKVPFAGRGELYLNCLAVTKDNIDDVRDKLRAQL